MIGWLADPLSWGPLTRALAVLTHEPGVVLSQGRGERQWLPLAGTGIGHVTVGCCGDDGPRSHLERLDADVLVADPAWHERARADGRPCITLGWTSMKADADWNLDVGPLHPWAFGLPMNRGQARSLWGVTDSTPVVVVMSPSHLKGTMESSVRDARPPGGVLVSLKRWSEAPMMVGADLIVTSAGWASSVEAKWSGVPHCLIDLDGLDMASRITHDREAMRDAVRNAQCAQLPLDWRGQPDPDPLDRFLQLVRGVTTPAVV